MSLDRFTLFGLLDHQNLETTKFQAESQTQTQKSLICDGKF